MQIVLRMGMTYTVVFAMGYIDIMPKSKSIMPDG